jgi:hypothetical protein
VIVVGSVASGDSARPCGRFRAALSAGARSIVVVAWLGWSAGRGECLEAFERAQDRSGPGPVGREVQGTLAGVTGEVPGDVQDSVAQSLGLADPVLAVEREQLCPDHHVVRGQRELEPRGVRGEGVKRQEASAGRLRAS